MIEAFPTYSIMTSVIPKTCLREIQKMQRDFIWGDNVDKHHLHTISYSKIAMAKDL